jgi:hypothetical protein
MLLRCSSLLALLVAPALAVGCGGATAEGADDDDHGTNEAEATGGLIKIGTYELASAPQHWVNLRLVIMNNSRYVVDMYPGRAFSMDHIVNTVGTYRFVQNKLTLRFESGNEFLTWDVSSLSPNGEKVRFKSTGGYGSDFEMTYSGNTAEPNAALRTKDPGLPATAAGRKRITCETDAGDVRATFALGLDDGKGEMRFATSASVETVQLIKNDHDIYDQNSVITEGTANGRRYVLAIPKKSFEPNTGDAWGKLRVGRAGDPYTALDFDWDHIICRPYSPDT